MVELPSEGDEGGGGPEGEGAGQHAGQHHAADSEGAGPRPARGFSFGLCWCLPGGGAQGGPVQAASIDREYDGAGVCRGVRCSTAVKGGWSGGRM